MPTKLTEVDVRQLAGDDLLIIESRIQREIWDRLTVQCALANGVHCKVVCQFPCLVAKRCIDHFVPCGFKNYARWN